MGPSFFFAVKNLLFTTDGSEVSLTNVCIYFLRLSTKKYLGEETFQVLFLLKELVKNVNPLERSYKWNDSC